MTAELVGKTALVTGAAQGIGAAVAKSLVDGGAHVILSDCKDNSATQKTIEAEGGSARVQTVDVADPSSVDVLFQSIRDTEGNLDFVVNAIGILSEGTVVDMSISEFDRIISVNLRGLPDR